MSDRDPDIDELLADLERTLSSLRRELDAPSRSGPRPPTPRALLRFTEEHTIPTLIAVLEANIRALELLQQALRLSDPSRTAESAREKIEASSVVSAESIDGAMADLRRALSATERPADPEARTVLTDARKIVAEIESRLAEGESTRQTSLGERTRERGVRIDVTNEREVAPSSAGDDDVDVDVDAELASIRESVREETSQESSDNRDGTIDEQPGEPDEQPGEPDETDGREESGESEDENDAR